MNQEKIGKYISEKRKEKKLTQEELAEKLRVSDKQYQIGRMVKICRIYHYLNHYVKNLEFL